MTTPADSIIDALVTGCRPGFDAIGADLEKRLRDKLRVPVVRQGSRVIRSKPGEPPRKDKGNYQSSMDRVTVVSGDRIRAVAGTNMVRGVWLENGTGRMAPRPHASVVIQEFKSEVLDRVRAALADAVKP